MLSTGAAGILAGPAQGWCGAACVAPTVSRATTRWTDDIGAYRAAARLTPFGGGMESGTKKSGMSDLDASTRYWSKSVTPFAARKVSSIRKLPVKSLARLLKI